MNDLPESHYAGLGNINDYREPNPEKISAEKCYTQLCNITEALASNGFESSRDIQNAVEQVADLMMTMANSGELRKAALSQQPESEPLGFFDWLTGLLKEDREEVGHAVNRPFKAVWDLYQSYLDSFPRSPQQPESEPVGHFYNNPASGRVGVEWCCDHLDSGAALYTDPQSAALPKEKLIAALQDIIAIARLSHSNEFGVDLIRIQGIAETLLMESNR